MFTSQSIERRLQPPRYSLMTGVAGRESEKKRPLENQPAPARAGHQRTAAPLEGEVVTDHSVVIPGAIPEVLQLIDFLRHV
ncbi:hypothetical protein EN41_09320 [Agrobacterium tumefaciens]|nr:hypothetical protein EN41_09320 [Agrobacterium tumefaciens]